MTEDEFALAMARGHVAEFEARVERQESLLATLTEAGMMQEAEEACQVLAGYRETLDLARDRLRRARQGPGAG